MPFGAGIRDDRPCGGAQQRISSPDHPARLNWKIGDEAGLLAWGVQVLRPTLTAPSRRLGSGMAVNWTLHSCGGSRGLDRVPFLASAWAEEPRASKATQCGRRGQC
ncbi:hypothetical protein C4J99_2586 [Pseudomonas synxantha]|nr:hypothetical protein C4J99_2586 [Pseudomonas synxantha]